MNLNDFRRFADLFDKRNSAEKPLEEHMSIPEDGKLEFFWDDCTVEENEKVDISSIVQRTKDKIRKAQLKRRKKIFFITGTSIAASILLCLSVVYLLNRSESTVIDFKKIAKTVDAQMTDEVTLITSTEAYKIEKDALITYSKDGDVAVSSRVLNDDISSETAHEEEYNILFVPKGKRAYLALSDGTRLTINSLSKVIYPRRFKGDIRKIYTQGEVYADVAHDKERPFMVETDDFNLKVLGTKFAVSNYKAIETATVALVEGSVEVTDLKNKKVTLTPNDLLSLKLGSIVSQRQVDVSSYISWIDGILMLNGSSILTITQRLNIYYGSSIQCSSNIGEKRIYGKLDLKNDVDKVLESIQQTVPLKIEKSGNSIILK